jgi:hypothetical protein
MVRMKPPGILSPSDGLPGPEAKLVNPYPRVKGTGDHTLSAMLVYLGPLLIFFSYHTVIYCTFNGKGGGSSTIMEVYGRPLSLFPVMHNKAHVSVIW